MGRVGYLFPCLAPYFIVFVVSYLILSLFEILTQTMWSEEWDLYFSGNCWVTCIPIFVVGENSCMWMRKRNLHPSEVVLDQNSRSYLCTASGVMAYINANRMCLCVLSVTVEFTQVLACTNLWTAYPHISKALLRHLSLKFNASCTRIHVYSTPKAYIKPLLISGISTKRPPAREFCVLFECGALFGSVPRMEAYFLGSCRM